MKDIVKNFWDGILNEEDNKEEVIEEVIEETAEVVEETVEFVAYLIKENDKGIYSTENGSRAFSIKKAGEEVDAAWIHKLGSFQATTHTAFSVACEMYSEETNSWMDDGVVPN